MITKFLPFLVMISSGRKANVIKTNKASNVSPSKDGEEESVIDPKPERKENTKLMCQVICSKIVDMKTILSISVWVFLFFFHN